MAKAKTKSNNRVGMIIAILLVLCLAVCAVLVFGRADTTAASVMECNVNPNIQFVLNSQNKVVSVNYLNDDAELLFSSVDFTNKTADEAAKLFVDIATQTGKIEASITANETVTITISGKTDADMTELKNKVVEKVNQYFQDNGIMAKAVCNINDYLQEALTKLDSTITDFSGKTEDEILALIGETSQNIDKIAKELHTEFFTTINNFKNSINYDAIEKLFENAKDEVESKQAEIDGYKKQIEDNKVPESALQPLIEAAEKGLELAKQTLQTAKENFDKVKAQVEAKIDEVIKTLEEQSKTIYEDLKTQYNQLVEQAKTKLDEHKAKFEQNKQAWIEQIKAWQNQEA